MLNNKENLTKQYSFKDLSGGENKDMFVHLYTNPKNGNLIFEYGSSNKRVERI